MNAQTVVDLATQHHQQREQQATSPTRQHLRARTAGSWRRRWGGLLIAWGERLSGPAAARVSTARRRLRRVAPAGLT